MNVQLSSPRGFCAGVVRAIDIVELVLKRFGPPVYVKHQIVHNPYVVSELERKGAITVEDIGNIPEGSVVIFSAHGSPPEDYQKAKNLNLQVIDATCPLVTKVHNEAKKFAREGHKLILVGHRGHQEVKGTMGQTGMFLIDDRELPNLPSWSEETPITVLTQTTLSIDDTSKSIDNIRSKFPRASVRNDLCYATTNRQAAVKDLASVVDIVLVIGSKNSSNCNRLREVAEAQGVPAYLVNGPEELDMNLLNGVTEVGITSGASTPESLVQRVIEAISPNAVSQLDGTKENVSFVLPKELL